MFALQCLNFNANIYKAKVALEAISGEKTLAQLSSEHGVRQNLVGKWKKQLVDAAAGVFAGAARSEEVNKEKEIKELHAKIEGFNFWMIYQTLGRMKSGFDGLASLL